MEEYGELLPRKVLLRPLSSFLYPEELVEQLASPERWTGLKAKQVLSKRDKSKVIEILHQWISTRKD